MAHQIIELSHGEATKRRWEGLGAIGEGRIHALGLAADICKASSIGRLLNVV